jgi:hypothetical protein
VSQTDAELRTRIAELQRQLDDLVDQVDKALDELALVERIGDDAARGRALRKAWRSQPLFSVPRRRK